MKIDNNIYSLQEMREAEELYTGDFHLNLEEGVFDAVLLLKAEGTNGKLRTFFLFSDGRKVIAPAYPFNRYMGLREIPIGTNVRLTYMRSRDRVYLTKVEILDKELPPEDNQITFEF